MCEVTAECKSRARFMLHVRTVPQPLGENGKYGVESEPAGRSVMACGTHLATAVRELYALGIRATGAPVEVRTWWGASESTEYRWIAYTQQTIPGSLSFDLSRHTSLAGAVEHVDQLSHEWLYVDCSATLYAYSAEAWERAEEFRDIGCPFDYPDRLIERGPRGGWRVERT